MDLNKNISRKPKISTKKQMNLYVSDGSKEKNKMAFAAGMIALVVGVLLFTNLVVIKKINELNEIKNRVSTLQVQEAQFKAAVATYDEKRKEYLRFTETYYQGSLRLVDRMHILDTLEYAMEDVATISYVKVNSNNISLQVITKDLDDLNVVKKRLESRDDVSHVSVYQADFDSEDLTSSVVFYMFALEEE